MCLNLEGPGRIRVLAGSAAFPLKLDLYEAADCAGTPRITRAAQSADAERPWVETDVGTFQRRSIGVSSASSARGFYMVLSMGGSTPVGTSTGGLLPADAPTTAPRRGSLSSPLPPGPVIGATGFETSHEYCRAVHGALAAYRASSSAQRTPLSNLSAAEHMRRRNLIPVATGTPEVLANARQSMFSASLTLFTSPFSTSESSKTETLGILLTASACDDRFGFFPVTRAVAS